MPTELPKAGASESKAPETWSNPDFFPQRMKIFERGLVGGGGEGGEGGEFCRARRWWRYGRGRLFLNAGLWRRHDRPAWLHGRSVHEAIPHSYLWGKGDSLSSTSLLVLSSPRIKIVNQSPTIERFTYFTYDSFISPDPHL